MRKSRSDKWLRIEKKSLQMVKNGIWMDEKQLWAMAIEGVFVIL